MKRFFLALVAISLVFCSTFTQAHAIDIVDEDVVCSMAVTYEGDGVILYRIAVQNLGVNTIEDVQVFSDVQNGEYTQISGAMPGVPRDYDDYTQIKWRFAEIEPNQLVNTAFRITSKAASEAEVIPSSVTVKYSDKEVSLTKVAVNSYSGGGCSAIGKYLHTDGWPDFPEYGIDLGILSGTWYEMGVQYGQRVGEPIQLYFDHRADGHVEAYGIEHVKQDIHRYEEQAKLFFPEAIEFMQGIADGAKEYLAKSKYADDLTDYEKILLLNCDNCLMYGHPGDDHYDPSLEDANFHAADACSALVALGGEGATSDGKTVISQTNDGDFLNEMYRYTFIAMPSDPEANNFWGTTAPGKFFEIMGLNDKGLAVTVTAGAYGTWVPEENIFERAFGVTWQFVLLRQMAYADNVDEAVELVTVGTKEYRDATGRKTLLRTRHNNYVIADPENAVVVEVTANRYATRRPGDYGEEAGFIVCTNHYVCDYSYDDQNRKTDYPMTTFGGSDFDPTSTSRYNELTWLAKTNYGKMNSEMIKDFLELHYFFTEDGQRVDMVWNEDAQDYVPAYEDAYTVCRHGGYPEQYSGQTVDSKVATLQDKMMEFSVGRPCEWEGMWQSFIVPEK